jgi:hypothetical protein
MPPLFDVSPVQDPHQLVSEAWRAMDQIYGAVFETPLEPSPWLAQQSEGSTVCLKLETKQATGEADILGSCMREQRVIRLCAR